MVYKGNDKTILEKLKHVNTRDLAQVPKWTPGHVIRSTKLLYTTQASDPC